jgi:hypothetical protein
MEALEPSQVPVYKGDMLRMALLWWLSDYWCPMPDRCRHGCQRPDACLFGRLCEPAVDPAWPLKIQRLVGDTPPPAYALWDLHDRRERFEAGSRWGFELTLVGALAIGQIPAVVAAVQEGAEQGMGRIQLRGRVLQIQALCEVPKAPDVVVTLAEQQPHDNTMRLVWQNYQIEEPVQACSKALAHLRAWDRPVRALSLRYLSPVKIKERGRWVEEPVFSAVMKNVIRRLRILSVVHGDGEWPHAEWGPLLDLAETVRLEHHETSWAGYTRRSKRSGRHEVEGFIGQAWYGGADLRPLLPALWLGQWLHIGKSYVLGNGRYVIDTLY